MDVWNQFSHLGLIMENKKEGDDTRSIRVNTRSIGVNKVENKELIRVVLVLIK